jgi:putative transposase
MGLRTYQFRAYPSASQEKNLLKVLEGCRNLYNMALAERKYAWEVEKRKVSKQELYELAKRYREVFPFGQQMFSQTA